MQLRDVTLKLEESLGERKLLQDKSEFQNTHILALKDSNGKLQREVAHNVSALAEKDMIIRNALKVREDEGRGEGTLDLDQKKQFYILQMELERLRKIVMCKGCNDREKEVVLLTCYHSFCQQCVDKNFQERNR